MGIWIEGQVDFLDVNIESGSGGLGFGLTREGFYIT